MAWHGPINLVLGTLGLADCDQSKQFDVASGFGDDLAGLELNVLPAKACNKL